MANPYSPTPKRPRILLGFGIPLLSLAAVLGLLIRIDVARPFTQGMDDWVRARIGGIPGDESFWLSLPFDALGHLEGMIVVPIVLITLFVMRRWRSALYILTLVFAGMIVVSQGLKYLVDRPRPAQDAAAGLYSRLTGISDPNAANLSFPSGHCVTASLWAIGIAAVLSLAWRRWWWVMAGILMIGMMWQRVFVNAHWFSDTLGGIMAGTGFALILWWIWYPLIWRDFDRAQLRRSPQVAEEIRAA